MKNGENDKRKLSELQLTLDFPRHGASTWRTLFSCGKFERLSGKQRARERGRERKLCDMIKDDGEIFSSSSQIISIVRLFIVKISRRRNFCVFLGIMSEQTADVVIAIVSLTLSPKKRGEERETFWNKFHIKWHSKLLGDICHLLMRRLTSKAKPEWWGGRKKGREEKENFHISREEPTMARDKKMFSALLATIFLPSTQKLSTFWYSTLARSFNRTAIEAEAISKFMRFHIKIQHILPAPSTWHMCAHESERVRNYECSVWL